MYGKRNVDACENMRVVSYSIDGSVSQAFQNNFPSALLGDHGGPAFPQTSQVLSGVTSDSPPETDVGHPWKIMS